MQTVITAFADAAPPPSRVTTRLFASAPVTAVEGDAGQAAFDALLRTQDPADPVLAAAPPPPAASAQVPAAPPIGGASASAARPATAASVTVQAPPPPGVPATSPGERPIAKASVADPGARDARPALAEGSLDRPLRPPPAANVVARPPADRIPTGGTPTAESAPMPAREATMRPPDASVVRAHQGTAVPDPAATAPPPGADATGDAPERTRPAPASAATPMPAGPASGGTAPVEALPAPGRPPDAPPPAAPEGPVRPAAGDAATAPPRPPVAEDAVRLLRVGGGHAEIRLDPPELGRVRVELWVREGAVTIVLQADRAETVDLLRRHSDALAEELRAEAGADAEIDMRFSRQGGGTDPGRADPPDPDPATPPGGAPDRPAAERGPAAGRIDLRL